MEVNFLGEVPLDPQVRIGGDTGKSVALGSADDPHAAPFYDVARAAIERIAAIGGLKAPKIEITE